MEKRSFFLLLIIFVALIAGCDPNENNYPPNSNVVDIEKFGIYLIKDSLVYDGAVIDTSKINVDINPVFSIEDIDYFDRSSRSFRLNKKINDTYLNGKIYALIENGIILALGSFYQYPNCCWGTSSNLLGMTMQDEFANHIITQSEICEIVIKHLPAEKQEADFIVDIQDISRIHHDSIRIQVEINNSTNYQQFILDPAKTPTRLLKSSVYVLNDCSMWLEEYEITLTNDSELNLDMYTPVEPNESLILIFNQMLQSCVTDELKAGETYEFRLYYDNGALQFPSKVGGDSSIWVGKIVHKQEVQLQ